MTFWSKITHCISLNTSIACLCLAKKFNSLALSSMASTAKSVVVRKVYYLSMLLWLSCNHFVMINGPFFRTMCWGNYFKRFQAHLRRIGTTGIIASFSIFSIEWNQEKSSIKDSLAKDKSQYFSNKEYKLPKRWKCNVGKISKRNSQINFGRKF